MPDYKKMYFDLFRATEAAIGTLIEAQQRCEEMLLEEPEPPLVLLPKQDRRRVIFYRRHLALCGIGGSLRRPGRCRSAV